MAKAPGPHFAPKAKNVIYMHMAGAPSQLDLFDYKPELQKRDGQKLARLEKEMNDLEDEREIMMYMRHEAGHAFNYAYELYNTDEWREIFGPFRRPYRDHYSFVPFSKHYVRHIAGWYGQKHPDEDWAASFEGELPPR